jgi:hypothetical protein
MIILGSKEIVILFFSASNIKNNQSAKKFQYNAPLHSSYTPQILMEKGA